MTNHEKRIEAIANVLGHNWLSIERIQTAAGIQKRKENLDMAKKVVEADPATSELEALRAEVERLRLGWETIKFKELLIRVHSCMKPMTSADNGETWQDLNIKDQDFQKIYLENQYVHTR